MAPAGFRRPLSTQRSEAGDDMTDPEYTWGHLGDARRCSLCGCLVVVEADHNEFHKTLARLLGDED